MKSIAVTVNDTMQHSYQYERVKPIGKFFDPLFKPDLTPMEMLELGVFGGKYMTDCRDEFPKSWFVHAKLSPEKKDKNCNYFRVNASQSLTIWKEKGWLYKDDPRGWFQWYCRYYMGRRLEKEDQRQIKRWHMMVRHVAQIRNKCRIGDFYCNTRQRQALLHWAYDSRNL